VTRRPISQRFVPAHLTDDYNAYRPATPAAPPVEDPALVSDLNPYGTARVAAILEAIRRRERDRKPQDDADEEAPRGYVVACACGCGVSFRSFWGQRYASSACRRAANYRNELAKKRAANAAALAAAPEVRACACGCGATFRLETRANGSHRRIYLDAQHARRANHRVEQERRRAGQYGGAA